MGAKVVSARLRYARMWRPMLAALMAVSCNARCYLDEDPTNPGASLVSVPPFEFGPEVVSLTEDQFENVMQISTGELWVVYFFAPWCSHCAAFKPVLECLPSKLVLPNQNLKFSAGAINCEKFQELCHTVRWQCATRCSGTGELDSRRTYQTHAHESRIQSR